MKSNVYLFIVKAASKHEINITSTSAIYYIFFKREFSWEIDRLHVNRGDVMFIVDII